MRCDASRRHLSVLPCVALDSRARWPTSARGDDGPLAHGVRRAITTHASANCSLSPARQPRRGAGEAVRDRIHGAHARGGQEARLKRAVPGARLPRRRHDRAQRAQVRAHRHGRADQGDARRGDGTGQRPLPAPRLGAKPQGQTRHGAAAAAGAPGSPRPAPTAAGQVIPLIGWRTPR